MYTLKMLPCTMGYLARNSLTRTYISFTGYPAGVLKNKKNVYIPNLYSNVKDHNKLSVIRQSHLMYSSPKSFNIGKTPVPLINSRSDFGSIPSAVPKGRPLPEPKPKPELEAEEIPEAPISQSHPPIQNVNKGTPPKETVEKPAVDVDDLIFGKDSGLTQFARLKLMYKKYWYVLIPVHVGTSLSWIYIFYLLSKNGFDIPSALQYVHISETVIEKVRSSNMGHYAIAYLCYKIITPLRYATTLGITTVSIKRLVLAGYIKPIPTKAEFIQMYKEKTSKGAQKGKSS